MKSYTEPASFLHHHVICHINAAPTLGSGKSVLLFRDHPLIFLGLGCVFKPFQDSCTGAGNSVDPTLSPEEEKEPNSY